jgi:hypothetical protein
MQSGADGNKPKIIDLDQRACAHMGERCWSCMTSSCYPEPTRHVWYDADDIEHAAENGYPKPTGLCGCAFCGWPALEGVTDATE